MGWLRSELGRISTLGARTTAGRAPTAGLAIPDHRASSYHATFDWGAAGWTVKDLGSRNGTWVDGRRLEPGASASLGVGSVIALGAPDLAWTMVDAGPPVPRARSGEDVVDPDAGGLLLLPDAATASAAVFRATDGTWRLERGDVPVQVTDGDVVAVDGRPFVLHLPPASSSTPTAGVEAPPTVSFRVSLDEEYVEMELTVAGRTTRVEGRSYLYLLLTLARELERDADGGGWVDREALARMLRIDPNTVNVHIHRARAAVAVLGDGLAARLVECRPRTRQIRLGVALASIGTC